MLVAFVSAASQKVLDVPGGSQENGVRIQQWDDLGNPQQHWQVVPIGKPSLPIRVQRSDYLAGMHINVDSSVTLYAEGRIVTVTHTHERLALTGGHAGVQILFYDANQHHLWDTDARRYGVDGKWIGQSDREDTDTQFADPDTMGQVVYVAIKHFESPNGLPQDIQNWLAGARQDFGYVAGIATDIRTILG